MKQYIILLISLFTMGFAKAQINVNNGINTQAINNSNVFLDASTAFSFEAGAPNNRGKGLVIPSVNLITFQFDLTLADGSTFPTYFDGMIVYNNATGNTLTTGNRSSTVTAVMPGYYYFSNPNGSNTQNVTGGVWKPLGGGNSVNIYNSDGTINTNRTVTMGAPLTFRGQQILTVDSGAGSSSSVKMQPATGAGAPAALMQLNSDNQALQITRIANTAAIAAPADGMMIYDNASNCYKGYQNGKWTGCGFVYADPSSGGTAVISSFNCAGSTPGGSMTALMPISGVTQTIPVTVTVGGTYDITTTSTNGIIFRGTGTLMTGSQNIILFAYGTPAAGGSYGFTLTTTPSCGFTRTVYDASSGGTAIISAFDCANSIANGGNMTVGLTPTGISQTIPVTVSTAGTYNITTTPVNGVTFSGSGTLAAGAQNITLYASGFPNQAGTPTFTLNTTPNCGFARTIVHPSSNGTAVISGFNCNDGSGAAGTLTAGVAPSGVTQTITATVTTGGTYNISATANGVTFSGTGTVVAGSQSIILTATGTPTATGNANFILNTSPNCNFNRTIGNNPTSNGTAVFTYANCSQFANGTMIANGGVAGISQTIRLNVTTAGTWNITTNTVNGVYFTGSGSVGTGTQDIVLNAVGNPAAAGSYTYTTNTNPNCQFNRSVANNPSSNGTAVLSYVNCSQSANGTMTAGAGVAGISQTIRINVSTAGTYSITTDNVNGVYFTGSGSVGTGVQDIVLYAVGNPSAAGNYNYTPNTNPSCPFTRSITTADAIYNAIASVAGCTSCSAYTAAADNSWIKVTAAEYNALMTSVAGTGKYMASDAIMSANYGASPGLNQTTTVRGPGINTLPAAQYVIGFRLKSWTQGAVNVAAGSQVKINTGSSSANGNFTNLGGTIGAYSVGAQTDSYWVLKRPSLQTYTGGASYVAIYETTNGQTAASVSGSLTRSYSTGNVSTAGSDLPGDGLQIQVISTGTKQW